LAGDGRLDETSGRPGPRSRPDPDRSIRRPTTKPAQEKDPQKGKAVARLDAKSRHKLRIQAKKVRYAAEFFANLFPGKGPLKRRKKFLMALEQLQAGLGDLNDIVVDGNLITGMGAHRSSRKRVFVAGLFMGREDRAH
jgi:triphosphatase